MKFAIPVIATLALVAANPVRRQDSGVPGLVFKGDKAELPSCSSGCDDGWDCFHSNGQDLCCPPGMECDEDGVRPKGNDLEARQRHCHYYVVCYRSGQCYLVRYCH